MVVVHGLLDGGPEREGAVSEAGGQVLPVGFACGVEGRRAAPQGFSPGREAVAGSPVGRSTDGKGRGGAHSLRQHSEGGGGTGIRSGFVSRSRLRRG